MFGTNFYPTPTSVIERMLMGADIANKIILEPSAGKGNIVDYLQTNGAKEVIACEVEPNLAKILSTKCRIIASDFLKLTSEDVSHIDMIVMNPPFSDDDKHILHAWRIAPLGCEIISLCNYQTLKNTYTESRKLLKETIQNNGRFDDFGDCFSHSERQTNVSVGCVFLFKPGQGENEFEGYFDMEPEMEQHQEGLVRYNYIRDIVSRYVQAVSKFDYVMEVSNEINSLTNPISNYGIKFGAYRTGRENNYGLVTRDDFKKELQKQCWNRVFEDMKMDRYVTKGVRETLNRFVEKQVHVPFTVKNVYKMFEMIVGTHDDRMNKTIIEAFELICSYSADNSTAGETWKTNSNYMLNKRFIIPHVCTCQYSWENDHVHLSSQRVRDEISDIMKVLCYLTGNNFDSIQHLYSFTVNVFGVPESDPKSQRMRWGQWYIWEPFFRIRGYKKGTMHFEFLNEDHWAAFNQKVASIKGWSLPNNTKKQRKNG